MNGLAAMGSANTAGGIGNPGALKPGPNIPNAIEYQAEEIGRLEGMIGELGLLLIPITEPEEGVNPLQEPTLKTAQQYRLIDAVVSNTMRLERITNQVRSLRSRLHI